MMLEKNMKSNRILVETVLIMAISLGGMLLLPQAKMLFALLPIVYLLIEHRVRNRTWSELGFKFSTFWKDLRANWFWFVLAGLVSQSVTVFWARAYFPEFIEHVQARLPFNEGLGWAMLLPMLAVLLLGEELTYRALLQGRLAPFIGIPAAIVIASLLFGLAHFSPAPATIVVIDMGLIFIDSILYGVIYARSNNLIVTWAAHLLGDIVGLALITSLF
jgi:membrane protease YdiL (CAAX protease family)